MAENMKVVTKLLLTIETDVETGDIKLLNREVINDDIAVGTGIGITGRFQSRDYMKNGEKKTAFEVSVMNLEW